MSDQEKPITYPQLIDFYHQTIEPHFDTIDMLLKGNGQKMDPFTQKLEKFTDLIDSSTTKLKKLVLK